MDAKTYEQLRTAALEGSDDDLHEGDRRDRPDAIAPGTELRLGDLDVTVLCPGRGRGWVCCGWIEGEARCIGTFELATLAEEKPAEPSVITALVAEMKRAGTDDRAKLQELKELIAGDAAAEPTPEVVKEVVK